MPANPFSGFYGQSRGQRLFRRQKQPVPLGPWPQGLFNAGPIEDTPNNCFFDINNLDVRPNGSLVARRGFHDVDCSGGHSDAIITILGSVWENGQEYTLFQRISSFGIELLSIKSGSPVAYSTLGVTPFGSAVKYGGLIYFISSIGSNNSYSATTALGGTALTNVPSIPTGDIGLIVKDRLFVINKTSSRVYYSKATDPTVWAIPDGGFFDVEPGNGQNIKAVVASGNSIYIFKSGATYLFTFTVDPAIDGYLRKIADIGANDAIYFEGYIYAVNNVGLYRVINTVFELLSQDIDTSLIPNPRLFRIRELIIFNNTNLSCHYVFNSRTKSWTKYDNTVALLTFAAGKTFGEAFESTFGQQLTWVQRGNYILASYNTNVPANGEGDNRDYHLGDTSLLGIAPTYMIKTGLVAPGAGMTNTRLFGVILDVTAKHAHKSQFAVTLTVTNNNNKTTDVALVADVPNHGDAVHDGISWSGTSRAYNTLPDSPVTYRLWSTGVTVTYASNAEDSLFNFEVRNIYIMVGAASKQIDTTTVMANS